MSLVDVKHFFCGFQQLMKCIYDRPVVIGLHHKFHMYMLNNGSKSSTHDSHPQWLWHAQSV